MTARRDFLTSTLIAGAAASRPALRGASNALGIPGPYRGRVVSVHHPGSILAGKYQGEPVRLMMQRGMTELTGAPGWVEAWRVFAEPGDVVGIKLNPVGAPNVISAPEVLHQIIDGLRQAGVKARDIVVYDRYRRQFLRAGFDKWLPDGVRWSSAVENYQENQLGIDGYDPDVYMEMPLVKPGDDPRDAHARRSYVARFLTKEVNKMVNLAVLKHHQSAGVTLALKNMSHGLVNNVNRSHSSKTLNACGTFIPAVVDIPVIRQKVVLHILDGIKGGFHGGPGIPARYVWEHKTMYFSTDPVALDKTGWRALDAERVRRGMAPIATLKPDRDSTFLNCQVEHIEVAAALGLGEYDDAKIDLKTIKILARPI
jgi:uncharacterized protein (DUF362 family)